MIPREVTTTKFFPSGENTGSWSTRPNRAISTEVRTVKRGLFVPMEESWTVNPIWPFALIVRPTNARPTAVNAEYSRVSFSAAITSENQLESKLHRARPTLLVYGTHDAQGTRQGSSCLAKGAAGRIGGRADVEGTVARINSTE